MSNQRHTPGPWMAEDAVGGAFPVRIVGPQGGMLAACGNANARLIAAAPDLLAACEGAAQWLHNDPNDDGDGELSALCKQLRAAIDLLT